MLVRGVPALLIRRAPARNCSQPLLLRSLSTTVTASPSGDVAPVVEPKKSRAGLWFTAIAGAAGIGVLAANPQLIPSPTDPVVAPSIPPPAASPPPVVPAAAAAVVDPPAKPKALSPREELDHRVSNLKDELASLRKEKRSKLVDMKKRSIKDEIRMIETGIAKLEKA